MSNMFTLLCNFNFISELKKNKCKQILVKLLLNTRNICLCLSLSQSFLLRILFGIDVSALMVQVLTCGVELLNTRGKQEAYRLVVTFD